jgi:hypothetical protein
VNQKSLVYLVLPARVAREQFQGFGLERVAQQAQLQAAQEVELEWF